MWRRAGVAETAVMAAEDAVGAAAEAAAEALRAP